MIRRTRGLAPRTVGVNRMHPSVFLALGLLAAPAAEAGSCPVASPRPVRAPVTIAPEMPEVGGKSEAEKAAEERLAAIEAAESKRAARVVILEWPESQTDHTNETLIRNIRARIARPDARFYPELDLYQAGRKEPNPNVRPLEQRARVPDSTIQRVLDTVAEVSAIPWDAMDDQDWAVKAHELRELSQELWFIDRVELREPLFLLYTMIGYAAENSNNPSPPFFEAVGGSPVNWYYYLAAVMAHEDPSLLAKVTDRDRYATIDYYRQEIARGAYPSMVLSFELEGRFDPKAFASEYQVFINGLEHTIASKDALRQIPPGRVDVYLARADGHSLSDSVQLNKLEDRAYFVRDVARKRMGKEFIDMLMLHPNECTPQLDGDILNYLSIYATLHPESEIYVGLAKGGSIASRNIYLWRWDRPTATLTRVFDQTGGFPVRFVAMAGTGVILNGANVSAPTAEDLEAEAIRRGGDPSAYGGALSALRPDLAPGVAGVPLSFQLRGHYGRLMVATGLDFAIGTNGPWEDVHQVELPASEAIAKGLVRERTWQRLVWLGAGAVLGREASVGVGPRGWIRTGWTNVPHAVDLTAHVGYASVVPGAPATGRVRPMFDLDFYAGAMVPFRDSFLVDDGKKIGSPLPTFGTTVSAGVSF